jgi:hypothetical protein
MDRNGLCQVHCVSTANLTSSLALVACARCLFQTAKGLTQRLQYSSQHQALSVESMLQCVPGGNAVI